MSINKLKPDCICSGQKFKIFFAIRKNKIQPAKAFLDNLQKADLVKILSLLKKFSNSGRIRNKTQFRHEKDGIFAFKRFQIRLLGFYGPPGTFIITNGFKKKQPKLPKNQLKKAQNIRNEFNKLLEEDRIILLS